MSTIKIKVAYYLMLYLQINLSWVDAQVECEILGRFLAEVKTWEEHQFLKSLAKFIEVQQNIICFLPFKQQ